MVKTTELNLGSREVQESYSDRPGVRLYMVFDSDGFPLSSRHTDGAVVLWNTDEDDAGEFDTLESAQALDLRHAYPLPRGPMIEHQKRAMVISVALDDGAYIAAQQMAQWVQTLIERFGVKLDFSTVLQVSRPHYCRWRDYLAFDCEIPYLLACLTAAHYTDFFGTRRSRYSGF